MKVSHKIHPGFSPSLDAGLPNPRFLLRNGWSMVALVALPLPVAFLDGKVIIMSSALLAVLGRWDGQGWKGHDV